MCDSTSDLLCDSVPTVSLACKSDLEMNSGLFYDSCKKGGSVYAHSRASTFFFHKEHAWLSPAVLQELKWRLLQKLH